MSCRPPARKIILGKEFGLTELGTELCSELYSVYGGVEIVHHCTQCTLVYGVYSGEQSVECFTGSTPLCIVYCGVQGVEWSTQFPVA